MNNSNLLRVIDTETTGLEGGPETVVEIASVDIVDGVICNPMSDLVKPGVAIGFEAMAIHHITEDMVEGAPLLSEVIGRYLGADAYVAHNAKFDKSKLPQIDAPWICTAKLATSQPTSVPQALSIGTRQSARAWAPAIPSAPRSIIPAV